MNDTGAVANSDPPNHNVRGNSFPNLAIEPQSILDLANAAFALQQRSGILASGAAQEQVRPLLRHINRMVECLNQMEIDLQNHTGQAFVSGMSLEVMAFQPIAGLAHEVVIETLKPTLYFRGHRIQTGQVIVATPEQASGERSLA